MSVFEKVLNKRGINMEEFKFEREKNLKFPELNKAVAETLSQFFLQETSINAEEQDNVGVFYDADVDGLFSGYILEDFLTRLQKWNVLRHMNTGKSHGITDETIKWVENNNIKWLFVVDAGSTNTKEINYLTEKGVKVVVLDHHPYKEEPLNEGAWLVNISKYKDLPPISGCGMTYRYIEKIAEVFDIEVSHYEVFVGITTISDMVNVDWNENRYYMKRAYEGRESTLLFRKFPFWGSSLTFYGWQLVPYLNAVIRVGYEKRALDIVNNMNSIRKMQRTESDVKRIKALQEQMKEDLFEKSEIKVNDHVTLCLRKGKDNLTTINGLVGNKLVSDYGQSALVLYLDRVKREWKGSFRGKQFTNKDLEKWNFKTMGHAQACGVVVKHEDLIKFYKEAEFEAYEQKKADLYVDESELTPEVLLEIANFNEFTGVGLPKIILGFKKGASVVQAVDSSNEKRKILILENHEVIDFTGQETDIYADEYQELIFTPTLSKTGVQLIRE